MKVAIVNYYQNLNHRGGETFTQSLYQGLSGKNQVIIYSAKKINLPLPPKWSVLTVRHPLRYLFLDIPKLLELVFTLRVLPQIIRQRPNVVIPLNSGWQALILSIYCRWFGAKLVIAGQSGPGWDDRWNLLVKPHLFIALTQHNLDWAKNAAVWDIPIVQIPNGVDLKLFSPKGSSQKLPLKGKIILCIAAASLRKKIDLTIKAVAQLDQVSLLVLGDGEASHQIDRLGMSLLGKERYLRLNVTHDQVSSYIRSSDLFTMVSEKFESFGIVYLEAMACGLPVVTRDDYSRREIVGSGGIYVKNPENIHDYSQALTKALKKDWKNIPRLQAEKFSWDEITTQYEQELNKLINS